MKKILFTLFIVASAVVSQAQLGITAGANAAKYRYTSDRKAIFGFNIGLVYKSPIGQNLYIQPELSYTGKGATVYPPITLNGNVLKYNNHLNYIDFNLPFLLSAGPEEDFRFEIGAGPYAGYLISAKNNQENFDGTKSSRDFAVGSALTDDFKALDYGINFTAGMVLFKSLGMHIKYDLGLANLSPQPNYPSLKTGNLSFNFTYYFGGKR